MNNTGVIFVRMCNTAGAVGLMLQYYCSTASTANFTAVIIATSKRSYLPGGWVGYGGGGSENNKPQVKREHT